MNTTIRKYIQKHNIEVKYYNKNIGKYTWGIYRTLPNGKQRIIICKRAQKSNPSKLLVLYHEIAHSTGHPDRLSRASLYNHPKPSSLQYNKEEAIAQITAALLLMRNNKNKYILKMLIHGILEQYFQQLPNHIWQEAKLQAFIAYCYIDQNITKDQAIKDFGKLIKLLDKEWKKCNSIKLKK